jgi:protein SCO1/2
MVSGPPIARFELTDHNGRQVSEADFAGLFKLVYFGFTHCRVVCPRSLSKLSRALDALGTRAEQVQALYITVDPARDTPDRMRAHLTENYPRFTGLTGSQNAIEAAKKAFRVFAERKADPEDPSGYVVPHSAISYLMAPTGQYCTHFLDATDEQEIIAGISDAISKSSTTGKCLSRLP